MCPRPRTPCTLSQLKSEPVSLTALCSDWEASRLHLVALHTPVRPVPGVPSTMGRAQECMLAVDVLAAFLTLTKRTCV